MSLVYHSCDKIRILLDVASRNKECCLHVIAAERVKDLRCHIRIRTLVKRQISMMYLTGCFYQVKQIVVSY